MNNLYLIYSLLFSFLVLIILVIFFGWQDDVDTGSYLEAMDYLKEKNIDKLELIPHRFLRPLGLVLALPFKEFFSSFMSLIIENVLFYFGTAYLIFKIGKEILKKEELAFYGVIFYLTAYPLLRFGPVALTDMGTWFFYVLSIYLTILFLKEPKNYLVYLNGLISGIGVLIKENGGMGALFFLMILLISGKFKKKEIFGYGLRFLILFLIPILINQLIVYHYLKYTYWDWYIFNKNTYLKQSYTIFNLGKNFFATFGLAWIFVVFGSVSHDESHSQGSH